MLWRIRRGIQRRLQAYTEGHRGVTRDEIRIVKHGTGGEALARIVARVVAESGSATCRRWTRRIEGDKRRAVRALGATKADPRPRAFTRYDTEAEALIGCATPRVGGQLLFGVVRAVRPLSVVEIGTAHGYGALYIGCALRENGIGKLLTLEGMAVRVRMSREVITRFDLGSSVEVVDGDFGQTLPAALERARPLDLLFSDGAKDPPQTWNEFLAALAAMSRGGLMVFDDIAFSPEIAAVWERIVREPRVVAVAAVRDRWGLLTIRPA